MKRKPLMRAMVLGGGIALLANPAWAGGESYTHDKNQNQAGQERTDQLHSNAGRLDKEQIKQMQQALQQRGMEPGSIDGVMGPQTRQALGKFQRDNNLQATGSLDERTAQELGLQFAESKPSSGETMGHGHDGDINQSNRGGSENAPAS
jgi:peptidoglycan hydrolase-like protein with peptidoglycan-binding domain